MVYNNLYPPVMDAIMPAFIIIENKGEVPGESERPYRLYFSLSKYNSPEMIQNAWLSLVDSKTNKSVLRAATGVVKRKVYIDEEKEGDNKYYIQILASNLKNAWEINKIYKAQIRFSSVGDNPAEPEDEIDNTMASIVAGQNANRFSEWSTVALLQPILEPVLNLRGFSSEEVIISSLGNVVSGNVKFKDGGELESYQIQIYQNNFSNLEYDSGIIFTDMSATNEIYHEIRYGFVEGINYKMRVTYTTKSAYTGVKDYSFVILSSTGEPLDAKLELIPNHIMGRMEIHVYSENEKFLGNLTVRRASSKTNFTVWEDVQHIALKKDSLIDTTWYDYGVESGVWYKYGVQKRNVRGDRGLVVMCKEPAMVLLEDIFLSDANKHLRIKFNPQISSYTHTLSESSTQTIGAKYPFIKRNANTHYRQFSISGLISHFMDEGDLFTSKEELYKNNLSLYQKFNEDNRITDYNDFILEQKFREKIEDFLYDGQIKLFRSAPEGTMLVRLMNVSLNPEPTLGRMLYSFSATAYEIADFTVENLKKYNLQNIGSLEKVIIRNYDQYGQIEFFGGTETKDNLIKKLNEIEAGYKGAFNYKRTVKYLDKIKLYFNDLPKFYYLKEGGNANTISDYEEAGISDSGKDLFYGYLVKINGKVFFINPKIKFEKESLTPTYYGYYELSGEGLKITSVYTHSTYTPMLIEYHLIGEEEEDIVTIPKEIYLSKDIGQIATYVSPTDELIEFMEARHNRTLGKKYETLYSISSAKIEAEPGTVFYLQDSANLDYRRFILGETGFLEIKNTDYSIKDICFAGRHLIEKEKNNKGSYLNRPTRKNEFVLLGANLKNKVAEIENPEENAVYRVKSLEGVILPEAAHTPKINNSYLVELSKWTSLIEEKDAAPHYKVIYYENQWYLFTYDAKQDVIMPTYAQIDYICEIEKGEYE